MGDAETAAPEAVALEVRGSQRAHETLVIRSARRRQKIKGPSSHRFAKPAGVFSLNGEQMARGDGGTPTRGPSGVYYRHQDASKLAANGPPDRRELARAEKESWCGCVRTANKGANHGLHSSPGGGDERA